MSAFVMTREQMSDLAKAIDSAISKSTEYPHINRDELKKVFGENHYYRDIYRKLYEVNAISYYERYRHRYVGQKRKMEDEPANNPNRINNHQFLKSMECWLYQSCEFDGYEEHPVYMAVDHLCDRIMLHIVHSSKEYNESKWAY